MGTVFLCCSGCSPQEERARRFPRHAPRHWQETTVKTGPKGGAPDLRRKCTGFAPDLHLYKSRDACYHYNRAERGARGRRSSRRIAQRVRHDAAASCRFFMGRCGGRPFPSSPRELDEPGGAAASLFHGRNGTDGRRKMMIRRAREYLDAEGMPGLEMLRSVVAEHLMKHYIKKNLYWW